MNINKLLKDEIRRSGISRYKIAQDTGISESQLCRFMQNGSMKIENAGVLLNYFGYELKKKKGRK